MHDVVARAHVDRAAGLLRLAHHQDVVVLGQLGLAHLQQCRTICSRVSRLSMWLWRMACARVSVTAAPLHGTCVSAEA